MDLSQLRGLVAVADELHFTRAAARLNIAQPGLSQQVRRLEDELGLSLVERTTRSVRLTEAGEALVRRVRPALAEIDLARREAAERRDLRAGSLTIGVTPTPGPLALADLLTAFHERHPQLGLIVREALSRGLVASLRAGELDLAFVSDLDEHELDGIETTPLIAEPLVLIVGERHRLAGRRSVAIAELESESFVGFVPGATIDATIARAAAGAGFEPTVAFQSSDPMRARALVARGFGVAVLPLTDATAPGPAVRTVRLRDPLPPYRVSVAWRSGRAHSPAADAFLQTLAEHYMRKTP